MTDFHTNRLAAFHAILNDVGGALGFSVPQDDDVVCAVYDLAVVLQRRAAAV